MSQRETVQGASAPGQKSELDSSELQNQENPQKKTNLARISKVKSSLQLAECGRDVEDELLEASLEEYE
jgi:hypothetical protein